MNALYIPPTGNTHMDTDMQTYTQRHAQRDTRATAPHKRHRSHKQRHNTHTHADTPLQRDTHTHRTPKDISLPTHRNTSTFRQLPQRETHTHTQTPSTKRDTHPHSDPFHKEKHMPTLRHTPTHRQPFPSLGDFPHPGIESRSPTLEADVLQSDPLGKPL